MCCCRPAATVRGWLRRFASRAEALRAGFTALACALDPDPLLPGPAGSPAADAVAAIVAAAAAAAGRWGNVLALSAWELAAAVSSARLLAPGDAQMVLNANCPWTPPSGASTPKIWMTACTSSRSPTRTKRGDGAARSATIIRTAAERGRIPRTSVSPRSWIISNFYAT
jgi:hypothetical protein